MNQPKYLSFTILLVAALAFFSTHAAIVSAQDKKEESGGDVFETIDPFKQKREDPFQDPVKDPKKVEDPFGDPPTESEKKESKSTESKLAETKQDKPAGPPEKVEDPKSIDPFGDPPKRAPEKTADPFGDAKQDPDPKKVDPFGDLPKQNPEKTADPFGDAKQDPENATGQAGDAEGDSTEKQDAASEFDEQFWRYLSANNYKNWAPVPGKSGDFYPGESPHGVQLKMYLNRTAAGNPASLPNGSVIIKENYGADNSLKAITVMYRSKGYNPAAGDWYWIKYNPDGTTAKTPEGMNISGAFQSCIDCHSNAKGNDHTFFNDGE